MTRSLIVAIAASAALAACAQKPETTSTPTPQASVADGGAEGRGGMGGRRGGMRGDGQQRDAMLFNGITLSADQQSRVDAIRARYRADAQKLDPRNNPDDREKMMQSMQAQLGEIRNVLTTEQQAVFDQNVQQMRERRGQRGGRPGS